MTHGGGLMKENGTHHQAHLRPSAWKWMMSELLISAFAHLNQLGVYLSRVAWHPSSVLPLKGLHLCRCLYVYGQIGRRPSAVTRPFVVPRLPYPRGVRACLFQNGGCLLLLMGPPIPGGWAWAKSGLVALRGRAIFLAPKPLQIFFPYIFPCVGQSVSGWVPLGLTPPPREVKCCGCLQKVGASPSHSAPPPSPSC